MKQLFVFAVCTAALGLLYGCGEDCDPCGVCPVPEQLLAQIKQAGGGAVSGGYDSIRVICNYTATTDTLFDVFVDESDEGTTISIDASNNPDFDEAVAMLTDGIDEYFYIWTLLPSGSGGGSSSLESYWLDGGLTGEYDPDLAGAEVTKILLIFEEVSINNSGTSTTYSIDYRILFVGSP